MFVCMPTWTRRAPSMRCVWCVCVCGACVCVCVATWTQTEYNVKCLWYVCVCMVCVRLCMRAYLDTDRIQPFKLPNVEKATNSGMIHDMIPNIWSANVYKYNRSNNDFKHVQCTDITSTPSMVILQAHPVRNVSDVCPVKQWLQTDPMIIYIHYGDFIPVFVDFTWCTVIFPGLSRNICPLPFFEEHPDFLLMNNYRYCSTEGGRNIENANRCIAEPFHEPNPSGKTVSVPNG